jgi:DNA repair protein RadC
LKLADREHEVFSVIYLDSQNCVLAYEEVFFGSISSCSVYPREIVKSCLYKNSANIFVCHNHPSGGNLPSEADKVITKRLQEALSLIDVTIIDHLIIGGLSGVLSFREQGLI